MLIKQPYTYKNTIRHSTEQSPRSESSSYRRSFNLAIPVISFILLALVPCVLRAQGSCSSVGTSGSASSGCVQVTVPPNRSFVVLDVHESATGWVEGNACSYNPRSCAPTTVTLSVSGAGTSFNSSISGPATTGSPGESECVGDGCEGCYDAYYNAAGICYQWVCAPDDPDPTRCPACLQKANDDLTACLAQLPASSWDIPILYDHKFYKVLPLSDDARKNGGTVTVQVSTSGDGDNASIYATLTGDVQFTLTQTPSSFRPMDASDPASNCPNFDPNNPVSDDCHIFYQLGIVWPSQGEMVPARPPLWSPRAGQHRPQLSSSSGSAALATIAPYSSRRISVPALGVRQGETRSSTRPRPAATARARGTVPRDDEYGDLTTTYNLTLSLPTAAPGAPAAAWLPGTSTNYTPPDRDPAEPDYVFDNDTGGLTDSYVDLNGWGYTSVVTSQDFGGVAELRATATVQGMTFDVNVVDSNGNVVAAPTDSPTRLCGTDFAQHPYASLPVDQDCNGIADSWEKPYIAAASAASQSCGGLPVTNFSGGEDIEQGYTCASPKGDGLTTLDEYRGFHTYVKDPQSGQWSIQWASTDPVGKQDVFFLADWSWPDGTLVADSVNGPNAILARETPFIQWHRVQDPYAGGGGGPNADGTRNPIQLGRSNTDAVRSYVVWYEAGGASGTTTLATSHYLGNTGKAPITIYQATVDTRAASDALQVATLHDQTTAHETGHRLDLVHPVRDDCCTLADFNQKKKLDLQHFTFDGTRPTSLLYARYSFYGFSLPPPSPQPPGPMLPATVSSDTLAAWNTTVQTPYRGYSVPKYDESANAIFKITTAGSDSPIPACTNTLRIWTQLQAVMDWTPRRTMLRPPTTGPDTDMRSVWHFVPADLGLMCITPVCATSPPALPSRCQP